MKKIILFAIIALFLAAPAMAATKDFTGGGDAIVTGTNDKEASTQIAVLSNNVAGRFAVSADQFAAITKHLNGSKNYATSSESTKIYWENVDEANEGSMTFEITLSASDTADFSAWDAL
ncbi:MAG: hypothetical protein C0623_00675 [Desulfuromonas sp.]|nr:MAG: hypothetical protein C0623_00675 [Desulfuromonas sp.]